MGRWEEGEEREEREEGKVANKERSDGKKRRDMKK